MNGIIQLINAMRNAERAMERGGSQQHAKWFGEFESARQRLYESADKMTAEELQQQQMF